MRFGQLQPTWLWAVFIAFLLWSFLRFDAGHIKDVLALARGTLPRPGPWEESAKTRSRLIVIHALSSVCAALLIVALLFRTPIASWIVVAAELPLVAKFGLTWPKARTGVQKGEAIGGLVGSLVGALIGLIIVATINPLSTFPLRYAGHLSSPTGLP